MLREYFPCTDIGASLYGGFIHQQNCFCKVFELNNSLPEALVEINVFLESNGYEAVNIDDFDETQIYENSPITISPHGYKDQLVLIIERDAMAKTQIDFLTNKLKEFRDERDWNQFHNPKDLAIALSIESNELLEQFLWKSHEEAAKEKVKEELADVFAYGLLLAEKYKFDLEEIILSKIQRNAVKYPVEKAKGSAKKYDEL